MSFIQQFNNFGYLYTFQYYLYEKELDYNLINYIENNNLNSFYICFFDIIREGVHYLITTDSTNDLHELITIKEINTVNENKIIINDHQVTIYYNNYAVTISSKMTLDKIDKIINITSDEIGMYNNTYPNRWSYMHENWTFDPKTKLILWNCYLNIDTSYLYVSNLRILSLIDIKYAGLISSCHVKIENFDMNKLFPHLRKIRHGIYLYKVNKN
jgi:hypothetical protein